MMQQRHTTCPMTETRRKNIGAVCDVIIEGGDCPPASLTWNEYPPCCC